MFFHWCGFWNKLLDLSVVDFKRPVSCTGSSQNHYKGVGASVAQNRRFSFHNHTGLDDEWLPYGCRAEKSLASENVLHYFNPLVVHFSFQKHLFSWTVLSLISSTPAILTLRYTHAVLNIHLFHSLNRHSTQANLTARFFQTVLTLLFTETILILHLPRTILTHFNQQRLSVSVSMRISCSSVAASYRVLTLGQQVNRCYDSVTATEQVRPCYVIADGSPSDRCCLFAGPETAITRWISSDLGNPVVVVWSAILFYDS